MKKLLKAKALLDEAAALFAGSENSTDMYMRAEIRRTAKHVGDRITVAKGAAMLSEQPKAPDDDPGDGEKEEPKPKNKKK